MSTKERTETTVVSTEEVVAEVSPRSLGGTSLFAVEEPITPENVEEFRSDPRDIADASRELRRLGFNVLHEGQTTISVSGPPKLFQDVFSTRLRKEKRDVAEGLKIEFFSPSVEQPDQELFQAPGDLSELLEGIAIARPPEIYQSPLPPLAQPDPAAYRYLFLPDELALIVRATRTHRLGTTGRNVVVGMIDTGHYAHPFFNGHGYRVLPVLLGPGAADPANDMNGHGTGESANIFAAAPDCRLRPIKGLIDPTGDFNVAMTSSPQPRVLTNSWGYNVDHPGATLNPYLKTLEAAVANAVANGIVVCFSAGNGQHGFPGSMPGVISVGGVHVNYPNLDLEASSYASSFDSSLYPSRHVPDVCGITGKRVTIGGGGRAPSHMLPVQPGSALDGITPSTGASNDGWGLFSGTSAASPLVAGVVALLREKNPARTPAEIKSILITSAIDVTTGTTATGDTAAPGWDAATGAGLVDAKWAWIITMGDVAAQFFEAPPELQAEMLQNAQMPQVTREFAQDVIEILRSR
jgi:subtilisin family serine protease